MHSAQHTFQPASAEFRDRVDAGRRLAARLEPLRDASPIVLALPRGGVPVAYEIARSLDAPLEVLAVRKLGVPQNPELGMGAIAEDGTGVIDTTLAKAAGVSESELRRTMDRETAELHRRVTTYRGGRPMLDLADRTVIVVDDGVATGSTDLAALRAVRKLNPRRVILAVPVCARESAARLEEDADQIVSLVTPAELDGVGRWYDDFSQVSDEAVLRLLRDAAPGPAE